jgi:Xaa-Pro aminopeptidase
MLTAEGCTHRRERLWARIDPSIEWLLIADPRHVQYLSGFLVHPQSFSAQERGLLLLERGGEATLLADNFSRRSAAGPLYVDREVIEGWYDHKHSVINRDEALFRAVSAISDRIYGRRGAVEAEWLPLCAFELLGADREVHRLRAVPEKGQDSEGPGIDLGSLIRDLRRCKLPDELALLAEAMRAAEAGHARAREVIRAGISEWDMYREIHSAVLAAAGRPVSIYGDFRGVNAARPKLGGLPTAYVLGEGDMFLLDYSVVVDGYRSDITNTLCVGSPNDKQHMLFNLCQAALASGEGALRSGAAARDVYAAVARPLREAGYADAFPHHAGHGIGLAHPEPPILVPESDDVLRAGDVVTLEPGLYLAGIGGLRIEHNYLVTDIGYERLSQHLLTLT